MLLPIIVFASGAAFFALIVIAVCRAAGLADRPGEQRPLLDLSLQHNPSRYPSAHGSITARLHKDFEIAALEALYELPCRERRS